MNIETFKFNLNNRVVPQAQAILIGSGKHYPTMFTYDKNGVEAIGSLTDLFKETNKDLIFNVLGDYIKETKTFAFILITEGWMKKVTKKGLASKEHKDILEGKIKVRDVKDKVECISFMWCFKSNDVSSGNITYPFNNNNGNIVIDYESYTDVTDEENAIQDSRFSLLQRALL